MAHTVLLIHSYFRWLVLVAAFAAAAKNAIGYSDGRVWTQADRRAGLFLMIAIDVQFLIGIVVYGLSPITRGAMADMATAMKTADVRKIAVEHPTMMLVALILVHVGNVASRKATTDRGRFGRAALFFGLALLLMFLGIPKWTMAS